MLNKHERFLFLNANLITIMIKKFFQLLSIPYWLVVSACARPAERPPQTPVIMSATPFYDLKVNTLEGKPFDLHQLKGKKILVVNTASECGYTPQYADLQKLHEQFGDKLIILGFPCNDFGGQEPGNSGQIRTFCSKNYGVTFQLFEKVAVKGKEISPVYKWLTDKSINGWNEQAPSWNFCKYLIDENGNLLGFYPSSVNPMDDKITSHLK
jgi:glutathione peroxidase